MDLLHHLQHPLLLAWDVAAFRIVGPGGRALAAVILALLTLACW